MADQPKAPPAPDPTVPAPANTRRPTPGVKPGASEAMAPSSTVTESPLSSGTARTPAPGAAPVIRGRPTNVDQDGTPTVYSVKSGDTLTKIAKANGTTVRAIRAVNNLRTDRILVGQKLKIPPAGSTPSATENPAPVSSTPR